MLPPLSLVISKGCLNGGIRIVDENSKDLCSSISDQIHGLVGMAHASGNNRIHYPETTPDVLLPNQFSVFRVNRN